MPTFPTPDDEHTVTAPPAVGPPIESLQPAEATPAETAAAAVAMDALATPQIRPETIQVATMEAFKRKKRRTDVVPLYTVDENGEPIKVMVKFLALDGPAYDELVDKHPPTAQQAGRGAQHGLTFQSALLAACVTEPKLTFTQWEELRKDPNWSAGELGTFFATAWRLCMGGLDVGFTATG